MDENYYYSGFIAEFSGPDFCKNAFVKDKSDKLYFQNLKKESWNNSFIYPVSNVIGFAYNQENHFNFSLEEIEQVNTNRLVQKDFYVVYLDKSDKNTKYPQMNDFIYGTKDEIGEKLEDPDVWRTISNTYLAARKFIDFIQNTDKKKIVIEDELRRMVKADDRDYRFPARRLVRELNAI